MDTLRTLWIGALVSAPLLVCVLSFWTQRRASQVLFNVARGAVIVALVSAGGLYFSTIGPAGQVADFAIGTWLRMPGFVVTLGGHIDGFAFAQMTLVSVVLLLVLSAWPREVSLRWLMLAWFGVNLATLASNLGQMFLGWTLSAWASSELARHLDKPLRPVWLVQRVSDAAMLSGFGIVWMHMNSSLEFAAWSPEAIGSLRPELIESIALCVFVGVIGRCAQLPLTVWLETKQGFAAQTGNSMSKISDVMVGVWNVPDGHEVAVRLNSDRSNRWHDALEDTVPPAVLAWWFCAAFLPVGIGLLVRLEPLFEVASHTRLLMVAVGAFTLAMCSASAAAQTNWSRVLSQFAAARCGLVLVVIGSGKLSVGQLGVSMFFWQSALIAVLFVANSTIRRQAAGAIVGASSFLVAGFCGRHAVADGVWEHARTLFDVPVSLSEEAESVVLGTTEARLWLLVLGVLFLSEFLTGFALMRAWFLSRRESVGQSNSDEGRRARIMLWVIIVLVMSGSLLSRGSLERTESGLSWSPPPPPIGSVPLLPLSLAGVVLAWWMYSKPSLLPEQISTALGPFARLSRNRFYWDDLYFLLVVHPATVLGEWLVWIDERVLGRGAGSLRNEVASAVGESVEPLSRGSAMVGALTTVGSVAVLAWMLLWLRS